MILINLLPHRIAARKRQYQFLGWLLLLSLLTGLLVAAALYTRLQAKLERQQGRNALLNTELVELSESMRVVDSLEQAIASMRARQKVIEELQADRNAVVHILNALAQNVPDGVVLSEVKQNGLRVELQGIAQSPQRISEVLDNFSTAGNWLNQPNLKEMSAGSGNGLPQGSEPGVHFSLSLSLSPVSPPEVLARLQQAVGSQQ